MNRFVLSSAVILLALAVPPRSGAEDNPAPPRWMSTPVRQLVEQARAATVQVGVAELKAAIDRGEDMVILDVRNPDEYQAAHIPGAVNLPRGLLEFNVWTTVPDPGRRLYVYCKTGARAALATRQLNELGYRNAVALAVGVGDWAAAGHPLAAAARPGTGVAVATRPPAR